MHDEKYHYLKCGLDDVYLLNGFKRLPSPLGTSIAISDVDQLHEAIGTSPCRRKWKLSGSEVWFLRQEMLMSQARSAHLLEATEQTIHRWQAEMSGIPRAAEAILRLLYAGQTGNGTGSTRKRQERSADFEDELDHRSEIVFKRTTGDRNAAAPGQHSVQWQLAA